MGTPVNWRDIAFKLFWTAIAAVAGTLVVVVTDLPTWWSVPVTGAANLALAYARQRLGETPPTLSGP